MNEKFPEYKGLDLSEVNKEILKTWEENKTFEMSLKTREGHPSFVFYEGPPSANGMPVILPCALIRQVMRSSAFYFNRLK